MLCYRLDTSMPEGAVRIRWKGKQSDALLDPSYALCVEGAIRASKTTICLWRELNAMLEHPGIHTLLARWTEDAADSILKPVWRALLTDAGQEAAWNGTEQYFQLVNGSLAYVRGLKAPDATTRYSKFRGLTLARAYIDQAEEVPKDIYEELKGRLSQRGYPAHITISPQALEETHWIAKEEFPENNSIPGRKYYFLSVYDNAHNLSAEYLQQLEQTYPLGHAKRRTLIEGRRGMNVIGDPVYATAFNRQLHERPLTYNPLIRLEEGIDFGKHHPCVVWRQQSAYGQTLYLGGILGMHLYLEDFLPIVQRYRATWFPDPVELVTCCDPAGAHDNSQGVRDNGLKVLQQHGFVPRWKTNANAPDVRLAMVERTAGHMRQRTPQGEAFGVEADEAKWLRISATDVITSHYLADGFEAGYVWDEHMVSVGSKQLRKPKKDGWYEHGQNCVEYLELNFSGVLAKKPPPRYQRPVHGPMNWAS